ncbi:MAG: hypothetical protein WCS86_03050 [Candidatus Paceibacterota bacterium]
METHEKTARISEKNQRIEELRREFGKTLEKDKEIIALLKSLGADTTDLEKEEEIEKPIEEETEPVQGVNKIEQKLEKKLDANKLIEKNK